MYADVVDLPFEGGWCVPTLWVFREGKAAELQREPSSWALMLLTSGRPYAAVKASLRAVLAMVRRYISDGEPTLDAKGFHALLSNVMLEDLATTAYSTKRQIFHALSNYSDWLEAAYGYLPLVTSRRVPLPHPSKDIRTLHLLLRANETEFFSHLKARKQRLVPNLPLGPKPRTSSKSAGSILGMTQDFAWRLIDSEGNPTLKALWLLGFFGGPRLSESMNLWICDVLPGAQRREWFRDDVFVDLPLVVICDPMLSRWTGQPGDLRETRTEYLLRSYNLPPRPLMRERDQGKHRAKFAGFKGMAATNRDLLARQIIWASEEAARQFGDLIEVLIAQRNRLPIARTHPYLFVNMDRRKPDVLGDMMHMSNVRKGFERAVRRIGEDPYRFKQNPHGMRHAYKDLIKSLAENDECIVQMCMGHRNAESQRLYGSLQWQALRHAMAQLPSRR